MSADTYTSLDEILEKVLRDNDYTGEVFDWMDAVEWAGECLDKIGAPRSYTPLTDCIQIEDHRGELPCNFHQVISVKENSSNRPMTVSLDNFFPQYYAENCPDTPSNSNDFMTFSTGTYQNTDTFDSAVRQDTNTPQEQGNIQHEYYIKAQWIFTTFKDGKVLMSYWAFPTDDNNVPLIPDDESFKQAVKHYIQERIDWKLFRNKKITADVYQMSQWERDFYIGQANTKGHLKTIDEMESWKNDWLRLIPKIDHHSAGFATQSIPEQRYTHNSYQGYGVNYYGGPNVDS